MTHRIGGDVRLQDDLDEFLEHAEDDDEAEADQQRIADARGSEGQRRADRAQQRRPGDEDEPPGWRAEPEGQRFQQSRRQGDENPAQRQRLHRERQQGEEDSGDSSGDEAGQGGRQRLRGRRAQRRRPSGAERDGDQGGLPERDDADDDPARVEHRQDAPKATSFGSQWHVIYRDFTGTIEDCWYDGPSGTWNLQSVNGAGDDGRSRDIEGMQPDIAADKSARARKAGQGGKSTGGSGVASRTVGTLRGLLGHAATLNVVGKNRQLVFDSSLSSAASGA